MNLMHLFDISLKGKKDYVGLEFNQQSLSFGQINQRSNQVANFLLQTGFVPGDRLAVYLENCIEMIDIYLASIKIGVIFVPINILYKEREIGHILSDAEPKKLIANGPVPGGYDAWQLNEIVQALPGIKDSPIDSSHLNGDSPAAIVYTSGTTGTSKGAILTHNNFISNGLNLVNCWQIKEQDRFLLSLPLFHVHALGNGIHAWLMSGCKMKLLVRFEHQKAAEEFIQFKPTLFFGVPTVYIRLLDLPDATAKDYVQARINWFDAKRSPAQVLEATKETKQLRAIWHD